MDTYQGWQVGNGRYLTADGYQEFTKAFTPPRPQMIQGAIIAVVCLFIGYYIGKPNRVVTTIKRNVLSQQAKIVDISNPFEDLNLDDENI